MLPQPVPGGGPLNVAVAAARLGVPSAFVGRVSTDEYGELIWSYLTENGVDLSACERGPEPTARTIVEHTPKLVFHFEGTNTADTQLTKADLQALDGTTASGPHIMHGGTLGLFRGRTAEALAKLAEQHTGLISLDPNIRPQIIDDRERWDHFHQRWLKCAHIYRASDEDLDWIWPGREPSACAAELLSGLAEVVFVTYGASGATCYTSSVVSIGDESITVPGKPLDELQEALTQETVENPDTVGAGDTFVGTVLASLHELRHPSELNATGGLAQGGGLAQPDGSTSLGRVTPTQWRQITERAVLASAITCSRPGADPPTAVELAQLNPATNI